MSIKELIKNEVDKLPDNLLEEVYDFVVFLESKNENMSLIKSIQQLAEPSFQKVWDNEEDAVYDKL